MDLQLLKRELPFKWRVQSFSKNKPMASCVAYIDSRAVQDLLDEVCGPENWQDKYYQVKDTMLCSIGIKINEEWVWKSDGGTETDIESEKGELSDAFKRAAVKWGVGRFLYSNKAQYVDSNTAKVTKDTYCYVVDQNGKQIWDLTTYINNLPDNFRPGSATKTTDSVQNVQEAPTHEDVRTCEVCAQPMVLKTGVAGPTAKNPGAPWSRWDCRSGNKEHSKWANNKS